MATYVMSDVHGLKNRYDCMMETIALTGDDHLYVIGDVIDRGEEGIAILLDLMKRDNVTVMLGNHEWMMLQYYMAKREHMYSQEDTDMITARWYQNHSAATIRDFEALDEATQSRMIHYLKRMPLIIADLEVNGTLYYLVHGYPLSEFTKGVIYPNDIIRAGKYVEEAVWNRIEEPVAFFDDRVVIYGHTPTLFLQETQPYGIWTAGKPLAESTLIDIDCGCAANNEASRLACLRLDDRRIFYF